MAKTGRSRAFAVTTLWPKQCCGAGRARGMMTAALAQLSKSWVPAPDHNRGFELLETANIR
eukprot:scaffold673609_cov59-Prasinocladus_malaysianus.AAC.1